MIQIKNNKELEKMAIGGKILAEVVSAVVNYVKVGVSELDLDSLAEKMIRARGGEPGFKKVPGYHHTLCMATNDVVVHGIPTAYLFKEGDVVGIDCGVYYQGFHTDMAQTLHVKNQKSNFKYQKEDDIDQFLKTGEKALEEAIKQAKAGNHVGDISKTIQSIVEGAGYCVVRSLIGHGVGRQLHEEPEVPGFLSHKNIAKTPMLLKGMTIAIEVIYNMGNADVMYGNKDRWTIKTADRSLSGLFERTVAITEKGPVVLTG